MLLDKLEPKTFEEKIYKTWEQKGYFLPDMTPGKQPFTIMMPPPNITGQLHMGHALDCTLQDIIIRYKRMSGYSALWLPGTDHASIATEVKIVEQLHAEGTSKEELGREEFLRRAYIWKDNYGGRISKQLRRIGSSCDWSREAFTMDEKCSKAVREVFVNLYEKGLIYRGNRPINWCPSCLTALSDAEVEYEEQNSFLWHIRYPYSDGSGYLVIATTRPETLLGDTAVAVNPADKRYKDKIGKSLDLPLTDRKIPIISDNYVEVGFGTGAVKITPAHDPNDFEVGKRHNLETIVVIDEKGIINTNGYEYVGMDRLVARKKMVEDLKKANLIEKIEKYKHNVGVCYRCNTTIEPMVSKQWFVKMEPLAKPAIEAVKANLTNFIPERFSKIYFNWMENIKDWCVSRQLWWGHRIPAFYCCDCGEIIVSKTDPTSCPKCKSIKIIQDEDVLDTWFSSALWPFSTLGYPEKTKDLDFFYPTNLLVTGYDIIFFWVARMIFSGIEHMGKTPFSEVLIHGIVRDGQGRKMSKSLGNGVDPLEIIDKYGADSLRLSLCVGVSSGADIRFNEEKVEPYRNFINKLWNAAKFVLMNTGGDLASACKPHSDSDKWILHKLNNVTKDVERNFKTYDLGLVASKLYDFVWSDFCDWYIEASKSSLYGECDKSKKATQGVLKYVLSSILKLLHPFIPFVTERIWFEIKQSETIMLENYPVYSKDLVYKEGFRAFELTKEIVRVIRNIRAEMNVETHKKLQVYIVSEKKDSIEKNKYNINRLANVSDVKFVKNKEEIKGKVVSAVIEGAEIIIPLGEMVDFEKEKARLAKEIQTISKEITRNKGMLSNKGFLEKAPEKLVSEERNKLAANEEKLTKLKELLQNLEC